MTQKPKGLSGFVVSKNCIERDYPLELCIHSMLAVCDEVVVGEMGSNDGTVEMVETLALLDRKVRLVRIRDWTAERANPDWYVLALNEVREHLAFSMAINMDADEVLDNRQETLGAIRHCVDKTNAIACDRINYCKSPEWRIPEGECLGRWVVRVGPSHLHWCSDEPHPRGEEHLLDMAHHDPRVLIHHLGFLRRPAAFYAKARVVLGAFFGNYDQRLIDAENEGVSPMSKMPWFDRLVPYNGPYPASVRKWMEERGYHVP